MLVALVLVPQEQALRTAEIGLAPLQFEQDLLQVHQARYDQAIFELEREDPAVMERLIRAKLQLIPVLPNHDVEVLAVSNAINQPVTDWIHRLIEFERPTVTAPRTTALASLVGPGIRLWVVGGATLSIFIGLVLGSPGEPLVREAARKILRIPAVFESAAVQPHLFGDDEEDEVESPSEGKIGSTLMPVGFEDTDEYDDDAEEQDVEDEDEDDEDEDTDEYNDDAEEQDVEEDEEEGEDVGEDEEEDEEEVEGEDEGEDEDEEEVEGEDEEEDEEEEEDVDEEEEEEEDESAELTYEPISSEGSLWADLEDQDRSF